MASRKSCLVFQGLSKLTGCDDDPCDVEIVLLFSSDSHDKITNINTSVDVRTKPVPNLLSGLTNRYANDDDLYIDYLDYF